MPLIITTQQSQLSENPSIGVNDFKALATAKHDAEKEIVLNQLNIDLVLEQKTNTRQNTVQAPTTEPEYLNALSTEIWATKLPSQKDDQEPKSAVDKNRKVAMRKSNKDEMESDYLHSPKTQKIAEDGNCKREERTNSRENTVSQQHENTVYIDSKNQVSKELSDPGHIQKIELVNRLNQMADFSKDQKQLEGDRQQTSKQEESSCEKLNPVISQRSDMTEGEG